MRSKGDKSEKALTLAELVIILVVIGVLSAVAIPLMRGRTDTSRWSEGKAMAVSIRTAADMFIREKGAKYDFSRTTLADLGFNITPGVGGGDFDGKYFSDDCFKIQFSKGGGYLITVDAAKSTTGEPPSLPKRMTLDHTGKFAELP